MTTNVATSRDYELNPLTMTAIIQSSIPITSKITGFPAVQINARIPAAIIVKKTPENSENSMCPSFLSRPSPDAELHAFHTSPARDQ